MDTFSNTAQKTSTDILNITLNQVKFAVFLSDMYVGQAGVC